MLLCKCPVVFLMDEPKIITVTIILWDIWLKVRPDSLLSGVCYCLVCWFKYLHTVPENVYSFSGSRCMFFLTAKGYEKLAAGQCSVPNALTIKY